MNKYIVKFKYIDSMPKREIPTRNTPNHIQTFYFHDEPNQNKPIIYQRCALLDHDVVNI